MASLGNNPIRVNAGNKCLNSFCISTYLLALSRDNQDLWCAGWIEHLKVSSSTTPVSNYLSYLLTTTENLPVNTVIFSSNNLPFSSHFTDHLNRRKKQITAREKQAPASFYCCNLSLLLQKPRTTVISPEKTMDLKRAFFSSRTPTTCKQLPASSYRLRDKLKAEKIWK